MDVSLQMTYKWEKPPQEPLDSSQPNDVLFKVTNDIFRCVREANTVHSVTSSTNVIS